jgi:PAS domain S-box-containing protein
MVNKSIRIRRALTGLAVVLCVGVGVAAIMLERVREREISDLNHERFARSVATAMAGEARHQIATAEGLLKEFQRDLKSGVGEIHIDLTLEDAPHVEALWHISPQGDITTLAGRPPFDALREAAAEMLAWHRRGDEREMNLTPLGSGAQSGVRFAVSQVLTIDSGRLQGGVIGATIGPQAFERIFQSLQGSAEDQFFLIDASLRLLMRLPRPHGGAEKEKEREADLAQLILSSGQGSHFHLVSAADALERHYSTQTLPALGLRVLAGAKAPKQSLPWEAGFWNGLNVAAVAAGLMVVLTGLALLRKFGQTSYHLNLIRRLAQAAPVRLWSTSSDGSLMFRRWLTEGELSERAEAVLPRIHPDDRSRVVAALETARYSRHAFRIEYRRLNEDGIESILLDEGLPQTDDQGRFQGFMGSSTDVTAIKEAERALAARELLERAGHLALAEERLDTLVDQAPLGIMIATPDLKIIRVNPAIASLLGCEPKEMLSRTPLEFTLSADADTERPLLAELLDKGTPYQIKKRCLRQDGALVWIAVSCFAIGRGEERRIVFFADDITAQHAAEEAVKAGEARLRSYFSQPLVAMYLRDLDGRLVHFNARFADLAGYSEQALPQIFLWDMLDGEERKHIRLLQDDMTRGLRDSWLREIDLLRADGKTLRAVAAESVVRGAGGESDRLIGLILDISELRKAQGQLERFRSVAEAASEAIIIFNPQGEVLFDNRAYEELLGGRGAGSDFRLFHPFQDTLLVERMLIPHLLDHGRWEGPLQARGKQGQDLPLWAHAGLVRRPDGHPSFMFLFLQDHSEQARLQADLRRAKEEAEEANAAKTRFLVAASHDLRQPLQALNLFIGLLSTASSPESLRQIVAKTESSLASFERLLNSVLDMAKLEAGIVKPEIAQIDVRPLLAAMEEEFKPLAALKGTRLAVIPSQIRLRTDPALLERILRNLVSNAVNHVDAGHIVVGCRRRQGKVSLEVWDSGPGIPKEQLGLIFQEFWQGGDAAQGKRGGFGLGLAIVDRLCTLLGHAINVRSQPGKGTVFQIFIPQAQSQIEAAIKPQEEKPLDRPCRILVIDDDPAIREGMTLLLSSWGHRVQASPDAASALAALASARLEPDIILADHRLAGGQSGVEAILSLQTSLSRSVPAIIITGDTSPRRLRAATESGFPVLHKPVAPQVLKSAIAELMNRPSPDVKDRAKAPLKREPLG